MTLVLKLDPKLILFGELFDFGLAKFFDGREELSEHGFILKGFLELFDVWLELDIDKFGEVVFEGNLKDVGVLLDEFGHFDQVLFDGVILGRDSDKLQRLLLRDLIDFSFLSDG